MPKTVSETMMKLQLVDPRIPKTDGRQQLLIRRTQPNNDAAQLISHLGLELPPQPPPKTLAAETAPL